MGGGPKIGPPFHTPFDCDRRYDSVYDTLATFYNRVAIGGVVLCEFSWGAMLWRRWG